MIGVAVALVALVVDQASKYWVLDVLRVAEVGPIEVTSFFNLVMVWNHGVSFGMLSQPGSNVPYFLMFVAAVIVSGMGYWLHRCQDRLLAVAIGLVIGGAIGNVIDRVRFGAVADFLDFHLMGYHYPSFNVADSCIVIGVMMLLWDGALRRPHQQRKALNS